MKINFTSLATIVIFYALFIYCSAFLKTEDDFEVQYLNFYSRPNFFGIQFIYLDATNWSNLLNITFSFFKVFCFWMMMSDIFFFVFYLPYFVLKITFYCCVWMDEWFQSIWLSLIIFLWEFVKNHIFFFFTELCPTSSDK